MEIKLHNFIPAITPYGEVFYHSENFNEFIYVYIACVCVCVCVCVYGWVSMCVCAFISFHRKGFS